MKFFYVHTKGRDAIYCPLRLQNGECGMMPVCDDGDCPTLDEAEMYVVPDFCPLRKDGVLIQLQEEDVK